MFKFRDYLIISLISLTLGWITVRQFDLRRRVSELTKPEKSESLAIEVSSLVEANQKLREEMNKLNQSYIKLTENSDNQTSAKQEIEDNLNLYRIVSGETVVGGSGLEINVQEKLEKPQLIDLLNALRNIGFEAISFNKKRVIYNFSFENTNLNPPYEFRVIGDKNLIRDSLKRRGGILEQINAKADIRESDNIVAPAIN